MLVAWACRLKKEDEGTNNQALELTSLKWKRGINRTGDPSFLTSTVHTNTYTDPMSATQAAIRVATEHDTAIVAKEGDWNQIKKNPGAEAFHVNFLDQTEDSWNAAGK